MVTARHLDNIVIGIGKMKIMIFGVSRADLRDRADIQLFHTLILRKQIFDPIILHELVGAVKVRTVSDKIAFIHKGNTLVIKVKIYEFVSAAAAVFYAYAKKLLVKFHRSFKILDNEINASEMQRVFILFLNQTVDFVYSLIIAVRSTAAAAKPQQESRSILIPVKIKDFDSRPMGGNQPIDFLSIG